MSENTIPSIPAKFTIEIDLIPGTAADEIEYMLRGVTERILTSYGDQRNLDEWGGLSGGIFDYKETRVGAWRITAAKTFDAAEGFVSDPAGFPPR